MGLGYEDLRRMITREIERMRATRLHQQVERPGWAARNLPTFLSWLRFRGHHEPKASKLAPCWWCKRMHATGHDPCPESPCKLIYS